MRPREFLARLRPAAPAALALTGAGLRGGDAEIALAPPADGAAPWGPADPRLLDALPAALARLAPAGPVRIEVDAAWARLFVLPWLPALNSAERWAQFAASRLAQRYDAQAADWAIRVLPAWPPHGRLVAALPQALVDALARAAGPRLAGLEIGVLRWLHGETAARARWSGCLVETDALQAWIFVFRRGRLVRVRARRERDSAALRAAVMAEWAAGAEAHTGDETVPHDAPCALHFGPRAAALGLARERAADAAPDPPERAA